MCPSPFIGTLKKKGSIGIHKEHVDRLKVAQIDIYYLTGESLAAVSSSPFLET
jgi:HSP90 family molecular chaperone